MVVEVTFDVEGQIRYWLQGAEENLEAAEVLIRNGKNLEGLFFAHLALEKALKAHVVKQTEEIPPRTHNLLRLVELGSLPIDERTTEQMGALMVYQMEGRYPLQSTSKPSGQFAEDLLNWVKTTIIWLKNQL
jgi:HEPN domain-containing protein